MIKCDFCNKQINKYNFIRLEEIIEDIIYPKDLCSLNCLKRWTKWAIGEKEKDENI